MSTETKVFSIVGYIGNGANAADLEVIEVDGVACWPNRGYNLRQVIYWTLNADAQAMADKLAAAAPADALVRVSPHYADADYITRNQPPIRNAIVGC